MNFFEIKHKSKGRARTGVLHLPHGDVQTQAKFNSDIQMQL